MPAAPFEQQATAAAQASAAAAVLLERCSSIKIGDAIACSGVRLLLEELAAARHAEPKRQAAQ
eukprot:6751378-Prymnesium_polylepis.1